MSVFFFFKQKTAYEMRISDWSSDVALPICGDLGIRQMCKLRNIGADIIAHREPLALEQRRHDAREDRRVDAGARDILPVHCIRPEIGDRKSTRLNSSH